MSRAKALLDLIESENPLQFWSMTKAEYEAKHGKPRKNTTGTGGFSTHKSAVEIALNQGKPVPAEVLKDYPELKLKYPELKGESYDEEDNIEIDQEPNKIKRRQSLLTEEGQGTEYKLRAEFFGDILELFKKKKLQMSAYTITCKFQPDVELEMTSTASLDEIKKLLRTITDSHVMLETVALKSEYTGDRKHED